MQDLVLVQQALRSQIPPPGPREQDWCYNLGLCIALCIRTGGVFFQRRMEEEVLVRGNGGRRQEKELNEVWLQKEAVLCVTPARGGGGISDPHQCLAPRSAVTPITQGRASQKGAGAGLPAAPAVNGWHAHLVRGSREPGQGPEHLLQTEGSGF